MLAIALLGSPPAADGAAPYIINGVFPGTDGGIADPDSVPRISMWQQKPVGIAHVYGGHAETHTELERHWIRYRAIPMISVYPPTPNSLVAAGYYDVSHFTPLVNAVRRFLAGPDRVLNTSDDRRVYMRYAWEPNSATFAYSPCASGGPPSSYIAAWRHVHQLFRDEGITSTRMAWIFSVINYDSGPACRAETLYPGAAYVDWVGFDAYSHCGQSVYTTLDAMYRRLRALAPTKPMGINEAGVSSFAGTGAKNAWITSYWKYLYDNNIRMSVWFNTDKGGNRSCAEFEKPWAIYGRNHGDTVTRVCAAYCWDERGFSAYRNAVRASWVIGTNAANPRLLTDAQFLGR